MGTPSTYRVKIVYTSSHYDDYHGTRHHIEDSLPWEDVTHEDLKVLARYVRTLPPVSDDLTAHLVVQSPVPVRQTVADILAQLEAKRAHEEKKKAEAARQRKAREEAKALKDRAAKRALLARLQAELAEEHPVTDR